MSDEPKNTNEPEVQKQVLEEIKTLGAKSQENYDELRKSYKTLQDELDNRKTVDKEKEERLKEDIITRQEKIDEANAKMNGRIDDLEVALKRPGAAVGGPDAEKEAKEAYDFIVHCKAAKGEKMTWADRKALKADVNSYRDYKKLLKEYLRSDEKYLSPEELKSLSVGVDPDGGYTVTPEMSSRIIQKIYETDPIRQLSTVETISTDALELMVDWDQFSVGWVGETANRDETSTAKMNKKRIPVAEMYAKPAATQQLLEDSAVNIEQWISGKVADRFSRLEGAAFVEGDGVNKPRGFLTYANGTSFGQIEQVSMGAAATLTADGFVDIKYALTEFFLERGTWLMNRTTVRDAMKLKDGEGNYLWKPAFAVDSPSTILSLPVRMSTTMPAVAANALSVALADWSAAYTIVDRLAITILRDPYSNKPFVEFYTRRRVGGDVVNFDAMKIGIIST